MPARHSRATPGPSPVPAQALPGPRTALLGHRQNDSSVLAASVADSLDNSKADSHTGDVRDEPWSPPLVQVGDETVAYLLCWEQHERDGSWHAWVTWIRTQAGRPRRHVVSVRAARVYPLEEPGAYGLVPRRVLGNDGAIRPWAGPLPPRPPDIARGLSQECADAAGAVAVAALVRTVVARTVVARTVVARTVVSYGWAGGICAMMSAALVTQAARRSRMSARQPSDMAEGTGPGTAIRGRPRRSE